MHNVDLEIALGKPISPIEKDTTTSLCPVCCIDLIFKDNYLFTLSPDLLLALMRYEKMEEGPPFHTLRYIMLL